MTDQQKVPTIAEIETALDADVPLEILPNGEVRVRHLRYDAKHHARTARRTRHGRKAHRELFDA